MVSFFPLAILGSATHRRKKRIFGIIRKFPVRNLCFYAKILIWSFDLFDLTLTWTPSKVIFDDVIGPNNHHYRYLRVKWPRKCVVWHVCDFYFLLNFWDLTLTLTFSGMTFIPKQHSSQTFTSTRCELEPFAFRPTDPTAQNMKRCFFTWPDLDLKRDIYLKMLNVH